MKKPKKKNQTRPKRVKFVPLEGKASPVTAEDVQSIGRQIRPTLPLVHSSLRYLVNDPDVQRLYTAILNKKKRISEDRQGEFDEYCQKIQRKAILRNFEALPPKMFDRLIAQVKRFK